ncbi:MAG: D-2-hydroxyacid dehydrogenase [Rhodospirillaceae bacterium]
MFDIPNGALTIRTIHKQFCGPLFLSCFLALTPPGHAEQTSADVIAKLGIVESDIPVSDMPGWKKPNAILVLIDGPGRLAWYQSELSERVKLIPAQNYRAAIQAISNNRAIITAAVGFCDTDLLRASPNLHWLHMPYAGVEHCLSIPEVAQGNYLITNMQKVAGPQIAEHVIAMMFYFARGLDHYADAQTQRNWNQFAMPPSDLWSINGKTMLVAGLGGIGTATARLASDLGMKVIATRNSNRQGPAFVDYVGQPHELPDLVEKADVIVNALPLTNSTRGLFNEDIFARMKSSSLFINVGRGSSVVTQDLIKALESGAIAGAGLDVQDPEPVPPTHPLWDAPNLLITPHISSRNDSDRDIFWIIMRENLRRYVSGQPMLSVVDQAAGY